MTWERREEIIKWKRQEIIKRRDRHLLSIKGINHRPVEFSVFPFILPPNDTQIGLQG